MATKSQGSILSVETDRAAAKVITSATVASDGVVEIQADSHGYSNGDIVFIDGVVGVPEINGRVFVVANMAAGTFELKGVDGTNYSAAGTGGSAYKLTMTAVGKVTNVNAAGGAASDIDTTHLRSVTKESLIGLGDEGDATFDLVLDNADSGQAALRLAREAQSVKGFTVKDSANLVACFPGAVKQFGFTAGANDIYKASVSVKITAAKAWFA
jgi:hypothetical protein